MDSALRKGKQAGLKLCEFVGQCAMQARSRVGRESCSLWEHFAVCGGVLRMRTTDSKRGPSWYHLCIVMPHCKR